MADANVRPGRMVEEYVKDPAMIQCMLVGTSETFIEPYTMGRDGVPVETNWSSVNGDDDAWSGVGRALPVPLSTTVEVEYSVNFVDYMFTACTLVNTHLRYGTYDVDAVCVCYDVNSRLSFEQAEAKWLKLLCKTEKGGKRKMVRPCVLVGLNKDKRDAVTGNKGRVSSALRVHVHDPQCCCVSQKIMGGNRGLFTDTVEAIEAHYRYCRGNRGLIRGTVEEQVELDAVDQFMTHYLQDLAERKMLTTTTVTHHEGQQLALKYGVKYYETSDSDSYTVDDMLQGIAETVLKQRQKGKKDCCVM